MRIFAIGDIHGCSKALDSLLAVVPIQPEDTLVTLGDYVDRGPDSRGVIERLIELGQKQRLVSLRGNHEVMMAQARESRVAFTEWCRCGGDAAVASYGARTMADIPAAPWILLKTCRAYYETDRHIFVHANAFPHVPLANQPDYMLYWEPLRTAWAHESGKTMICGHTSQRSGQPLDLGSAICIDTYAHGGGWLTCLEVGSRLYWQANQLGATREGALG